MRYFYILCINLALSNVDSNWYIFLIWFRCGHCKKIKPEFEKAAAVLKANDPPVTLAKVDCTEGGKDTCGRFSVSGYPTVKIFRNGKMFNILPLQIRETEKLKCLQNYVKRLDMEIRPFILKEFVKSMCVICVRDSTKVLKASILYYHSHKNFVWCKPICCGGCISIWTLYF